MSRLQRSLGTKGQATLALLFLSVGTGLTVVGSQRDVALLVVAGVAVIALGLRMLRLLAQNLLNWLDRRGL